MVRGLLVAINWAIGRHGRSDLQLKSIKDLEETL